VDQFCAACALVPGTFSFDEQGVITSSLLGAVSKSLSLTILEDWEVFRGSVVSRKDLPESVPWKDAWRIETKHFAIVTNVSGDLCRTLGRALEAAREIYREETGYDVAARITVHVPATRKKYVGLWLEQNRPAPEPTNLGKCYRDYCAVDGSKPTREVISVALHEVAHGYLNLGLEAESGRRGTTMPPWYHEGLATYCAGYGKDSLSWRRGVVLPEIAKAAPLGAFREIVTKGEAIPLEKFLGAEPGGTAYYLQACAFFWFFHDTEDADLRARFADAVKALRKARLTEDRIERGREIFLSGRTEVG